MKKFSKTLRTVIECTLVVLIGGLLVSFINRIPTESEPKVKNIIFMIGDGMGIAHITATMIEQDYAPLALERAEYVGLQKTYSANNLITDSAAAGTALAAGTKTYNGAIGVDSDKQPVENIREVAEGLGMATGVVATYAVTHATPASFVGHVESRHDQDRIAEQFLESDIDVFFGGGQKYFSQRDDNLDLVAKFQEKGYTIGSSLEELADVHSGKAGILAARKGLPSILKGRDTFLPDATTKALEILTANAKAAKSGFFLMVEGSQIDGEAHGNNIEGVVAETLDFDAAVKIAFDYADAHEGTLVVVTADHETGGLTIINNNNRFDVAQNPYEYHFSTGGHSGGMVPIFAYGAGADAFSRVLENTDIPTIMKSLLTE
ncbi:MAG: alkaline phosphatase [Tidjanibacter sp.]|nr:alkaline phosphatase [Tidjanibacter sp.]